MRTATCLALLIALAAVSSAQDEAPPKPEIKLYRLDGAQWAYRIVSWVRNSNAESSTEDHRITGVADGQASVKIEGRNFSGTNHWSSSKEVPLEAEHPLHDPWSKLSGPTETLKVGAGEFHCRRFRTTSEGIQTTTWVSTEYHPLIVKQVVLSAASCQVRTLTSFDSGEVDPWLLYRMPGRAWTLKLTQTGEDDQKTVQFMHRSVIRCSATDAVIQAWSSDGDSKPLPDTQEEIEVPFSGPEPRQGTRENLKVEAGTFDCILVNDEKAKVRTWYSLHWQALVVAQEGAGFRYELVDFDLGHDAGAFHRAVGNEHTIRTVMEFGGNTVRNSTRTRVTAIAEGIATVEVTSLDEDGSVVSSEESRLPVVPDSTPRMPYDGQQEVLLTTPAGNYPAIVFGEGTVRSWQHHGKTIRMESKGDGFSMRQELTGLKLE